MLISRSGLPVSTMIAEQATLTRGAREERLCGVEQLCRMWIETTSDGVWLTDGEQRTTFVNRRMADMLGYRTEEIQGHPVSDFMFPEDACDKLPDFLRHPGLETVGSYRFRRKDGSEVWARVSAGPLLDPGGELTGVTIIASDISLLRNTEDTLRRAEKLITAGRLTATITHEINSPLDAVANMLYLLRSEAMSEPGQRYLRLAEREIQRVSAIARRTLGLFRDSAGWAEFSLADLLDDTLLFYQSKIVAQSIRVRHDYRSRGMARASRGGLQQVFANLISNALDAMSNGGVLTVRVLDGVETQGAGVRVEVEDTGQGIADGDLQRVFDPFFTTKQNGGTGLGLWVAKEIIEKHGGTVAVTSRTQPSQERGTRFSILLPHSTAQAAA
jgi:PAS domain S-box-containing protein